MKEGEESFWGINNWMFNLIILRGQKNQNLALKMGWTNIKIYFHAKKLKIC